MWIYAAQEGAGGWIYAAQSAAPSGAPVLTFPNGFATGSTTAGGEVITDTGSGTLYSLISGNATELVATVKSFGTPSTVGAAGLQNVAFSGLAPATPYFTHYVHSNGGNDSAVASSGQFTTFAAASIVTDVFRNWAGNALANLVVENVIVMALNRTVLLSLPNQSTDAQGRLTLTGAGLQVGVPVMVATWNASGTVRGIETYTPA